MVSITFMVNFYYIYGLYYIYDSVSLAVLLKRLIRNEC